MSWTRLSHLLLGALLALAGALVIVGTPGVRHATVAGAVFVAAGTALVAAALVERLRPGRRGRTVVAVTAVVGTLASLFSDTHGIQAQWDVYHLRGYPWPWLEQHTWYSTLGLPPDRREWALSLVHLLPDLVFWGCVGILITVAFRLIRVPRRAPDARTVTPAA